jgi:hypothetical protein
MQDAFDFTPDWDNEHITGEPIPIQDTLFVMPSMPGITRDFQLPFAARA